ncbi:MAG TPA: hypothetical protein VFC74_00090, partial [Oscillospiraceae bacterium]|nr:hypothetical protein [Oscillospiraceae bacterium]
IILFTLLAFSYLSAHANQIPRYNPEAYCQQVANFSGGSSMILNGCIDMEQQSYNNLKRIWASIPNRTQNYCEEVASTTPYVTLVVR